MRINYSLERVTYHVKIAVINLHGKKYKRLFVGHSKYAVINNNALNGFFSVKKVEDKTFDIGIGMRPDLTKGDKGI